MTRNSLCLLLPAALLLAACSPGDSPTDSSSNPQSPANSEPRADDDRQQIDLVIPGSHIVTLDEDAPLIEDGAVAVLDGLIIDIGPQADIDARYRAQERLDGEGRIVMPGLINGHSHAAMTLLRGVADDLALMDWLNNYIFPAEVEFVDRRVCAHRHRACLLGDDSRRHDYVRGYVLLP